MFRPDGFFNADWIGFRNRGIRACTTATHSWSKPVNNTEKFFHLTHFEFNSYSLRYRTTAFCSELQIATQQNTVPSFTSTSIQYTRTSTTCHGARVSGICCQLIGVHTNLSSKRLPVTTNLSYGYTRKTNDVRVDRKWHISNQFHTWNNKNLDNNWDGCLLLY